MNLTTDMQNAIITQAINVMLTSNSQSYIQTRLKVHTINISPDKNTFTVTVVEQPYSIQFTEGHHYCIKLEINLLNLVLGIQLVAIDFENIKRTKLN